MMPGLAQARDLTCGLERRRCLSLAQAVSPFTLSAQQQPLTRVNRGGGGSAHSVDTHFADLPDAA